jgi:hypothetical protein
MSLDWATADMQGKLPMPTRRANIAMRAMYIPIRFTFKQRKSLRIVEGALSVFQYADQDPEGIKPQIITRNKLRDISSILSGLLVASSYDEGQDLLKNKDFSQNKQFFMDTFEIGRRHKIMNPDKMRSEYGKMIYLLQDMVMYREALEFNIKSGIRTVYSYLKARGASEMLDDPDIHIATKEIYDGSKGKYETQREIKEKEKVLKRLCKRYESHRITSEELQMCIYSITDNNSFLNANALPVEKMIGFLKKYFRQDKYNTETDLSISSGTGGARLSHSHDTQYNYVLQSLMLWKEIIENMFMLWALAEDDLLSETHPYKLVNTGQGLQRVQECPQVARVMHAILENTQKEMGGWVGSSTIHLGDHNVPNALMFIDKYTQVPRILVPIVTVIESIDHFMGQASTKKYIEAAFGSADGAKMAILTDFFRHGFDGSGADNFYDAGSCIDGRLTSAWNWCSQLEKKKYYPLFLLSGFLGFDGDFQK